MSYWETGQHDKALKLTEKGTAMIERAADRGDIARSALDVPYANLASMNRQLGDADKANHYEHLAGKNNPGATLR